jgi:hypothetical protein
MKKLFYILFALTIVVGATLPEAKAQVTFTSVYDLPTDTVTNTGTVYVGARIPGKLNNVIIQANFVKISGTVAGTASLLGSIDGVNYSSVSTTTYTVTNVANQSFIWNLTGNPALFYRVSVTGVGTQAHTLAAVALPRK